MPSAWAFRPVRSVAISTVPLPTKGIEDKTVAPGTVLDGIRYQSDRLDSRMHRKFLKLTKFRSVYASIVPNIRTRPAMLTKLDRVDMRRTAVLLHERRRAVIG